ncbi:hypothetical protein NDU88_006327 [Pleurodeles waltl]|uniref:Uncharacterized protein n=1 Tax=Pleurodeles waltl TaxID=8319 RepID=A0AAV7MZ74_PLEWA|nr:hypothetical protein NDU88_006327 [Pleurodeles waltl]
MKILNVDARDRQDNGQQVCRQLALVQQRHRQALMDEATCFEFCRLPNLTLLLADENSCEIQFLRDIYENMPHYV